MIKKCVKYNKRGQITIFIILGVVLIGAIAAFFAFKGNPAISIGGKEERNPESFLNSCIKDKLREAIDEVSLSGGYIDGSPSINYSFSGEGFRRITYLCYTQNYYDSCINQKPLFTQDIKQEIKTQISSYIKGCFDEMEQSFSQDNNQVSLQYRDFEVEMAPKKVVIKTDSDVALTKNDQTTTYKDLEVNFPSKLYELTRLAQEIVNQEARFCYAEILGIGITYPEFIINKFDSIGSEIYTIKHRESGEEFRFAVRGCVIPPGLGASTEKTAVSQ